MPAFDPDLSLRQQIAEPTQKRFSDPGSSIFYYWDKEVFPGGSVVKNPPANAGDAGTILGLGRPSGGGNGNPLHILAWKIPWTEEPRGLYIDHRVA